MSRLAAALAVGALAVAAVALVVLALDRGSSTPDLPRQGASAAAFVDSVGVNVHFAYLGTAYERTPDVLARLNELGVRHVRDGAPVAPGPLTDGLQQAAAAGIRATVISDPAVDPERLVGDSLARARDAIAAFEAPNELDNSGDPNWPARLRAYVPRLAAAVREQAPGVPLIGPSFIDPSHRLLVPDDLPGMFNGHPYAAGQPPESALHQALSERRATVPDRGVVFTEAGYHNALAATIDQPPASEQAAAVYIPRILATAFGAGVTRTFIYELVDLTAEPGLTDPVQHWGLLRYDFSPKPAFTAVKTLITAVRTSPGPRTDGFLEWRLSQERDEPVERLVLRRRDGSLAIALWRPVSVWDVDERKPLDPGQLRVELSFPDGDARDVDVWRPSVSAEPVLHRRRAARLGLELEGDLVVVSAR
jgi:hypothetical protein